MQGQPRPRQVNKNPTCGAEPARTRSRATTVVVVVGDIAVDDLAAVPEARPATRRAENHYASSVGAGAQRPRGGLLGAGFPGEVPEDAFVEVGERVEFGGGE